VAAHAVRSTHSETWWKCSRDATQATGADLCSRSRRRFHAREDTPRGRRFLRRRRNGCRARRRAGQTPRLPCRRATPVRAAVARTNRGRWTVRAGAQRHASSEEMSLGGSGCGEGFQRVAGRDAVAVDNWRLNEAECSNSNAPPRKIGRRFPTSGPGWGVVHGPNPSLADGHPGLAGPVPFRRSRLHPSTARMTTGWTPTRLRVRPPGLTVPLPS